MNRKLLKQVQEKIREKPAVFDMDQWFGENECGTTACIAGHAWEISNRDHRLFSLTGVKNLLNINSEQTERLFFVYNWPDDMADIYYDAMVDEDYQTASEVAIARIELFINTRGKL